MNIEDINNLIVKTKKLKILYVEDNEDSINQTMKIFLTFFNRIDTAVDGIDGLKKYKASNNSYDIVISDINMPNMNGVEMTKAIYELNSDQKVLILSAYNDSEQLQELMDVGITNYIHKPIKIQSLIVELQKIMLLIEKKEKEKKELEEIKKLNHELDVLIDSFNTYVIASRTDLKGVITYASKAYETISGYLADELIGKPHNIVRHPDMPSSAFKDLWKTIKSGKLWTGEVKNLRRDGSYYWVVANIAPYYDANGKHIGYSSIRTDITAQKEIEKLNNDITNLLNNAGQGFLSFDCDMKIGSSFSKECLDIFGLFDIANENVSDILFYNDISKQELFIDGIKRALDASEYMIKDMFLSLLPKEHTINEKDISIEYKALKNNMFMLILTDITKTKLLEHKLKEQNQIQKMIVAVASNQNDFIELKLSFENFIAKPTSNLTVLLRELHTFKGIFAQKEMLNITNAIHQLESKINNTKDKSHIIKLVYDCDLQNIFNQDLEIISSILGDDFLSSTPKISIKTQTLDDLELKIKALESKDKNFSDIVHDFELMRYESVYDMLKSYPLVVKKISQKLEKDIFPLEIIGDKNLTISPKFKPFMQSLIHLFNNCVDHGIEDMETRVEKGKNETGRIKCEFYKIKNSIKIIIGDDGTGIDVEKLAASAAKKGIIIDDEQTMLVFADRISTKERLTTTSGRGVGMSSIKSEVTKLGGHIEIKNNLGVGVEFIFTLPL